MSCFCRGWQSPLGGVCVFLGQCGQVKRVFCAWWNRWDPYSHWHAILPLPPPTGVLCICITLIGAQKRVRFFLYSLASSLSVSLFYKGPIMSWPSYCIFLCSKAQFCCAISFCDAWIGMWSFVVKRGHMNVSCPLRLRRLNHFSIEAEQKQVLPIVVWTRSQWTWLVDW